MTIASELFDRLRANGQVIDFAVVQFGSWWESAGFPLKACGNDGSQVSGIGREGIQKFRQLIVPAQFLAD